MKKRIVLFLAMLATVVILAVGFTIGTSAQTYDVSTADDFTAKINSAASGDVINVTADITVGTTHTIDKTLTVTSENGSTVTATVDNLFSVGADGSTSGNLTIEGNVTISYPEKGTIVRMVNGILTVQGEATVVSSWTTVRMATDGGLVATSHVYVKENATLEATINNENDYVFYVNGGGLANLHIQGGTVRHTAGYAISFPGGNIEVSGGTVTGMYGIFAWYNAGSAIKTITVSGGTVEGSVTGIYFKENTKNCTVNITGGTVTGATHAFDCRSTQSPSNNAVNISGGTLTAESQTMFFYRCTAVALTVTGGTIEASNGGLAIYGAELRGNLTLNVSGTANITATGNDTINVTMPGNTATYPGILAATISNGTISAGGEHTINVQNGNVTITGGTISAGSVAIYANKTGGTISISGGTITAGVNTIAFDAAGARTLNISGTARIISTGNVAILGTSSATPTITITGGTITAAGDFCIDTRGGTVEISGGTLTAEGYWGFYVRGSVAYTITGGKLTASGALFGFSSGSSGASLNITGGTFLINGSGNGAFVARPGATSGSTITISGGLFVNSSTANIENVLVAASLISENTVTVTSCKVLYRNNVANIVTGTPAPKTAYAVYDANGNGIADEGETYFFFAKRPATSATFSGEMAEGASVRLANESGIRFTSEYSADVVTALNAQGSVTYGTIILPTTYLARVDAFTKEALDAAGIIYADIVADEGLIDNGNGSYTVRAALTNLSENNYELSFSAIGYALVNGNYYYTAYSTADNARTIKEIAQAALNDLSDTQTGEYQNEVDGYGVEKYSPYTAVQRTALEDYIGATASYRTARQNYYEVTGLQLPLLTGVEADLDSPYTPGCKNYELDIWSDATTDMFDTLEAFFDGVPGWAKDEPVIDGSYTHIWYRSAAGSVGITWDGYNNGLYVHAEMN